MTDTLAATVTSVHQARQDAYVGLRLALQAEQPQRATMWKNTIRELDRRMRELVTANVGGALPGQHPPRDAHLPKSRRAKPEPYQALTDKPRPASPLKDIRPFVRKAAKK